MDIRAQPVRRSAIVDRIHRDTAIDEPMIARLVEAFYARVRTDPLLGPIFEARISGWDEHLATMRRFWASVVLMSGTYSGQPMQRHTPLPLSAAHFDRWLDLFRDTARAVCQLEAAALFIDRAERIAQSLEMGIAVSRGNLLKQGERLGAAD